MEALIDSKEYKTIVRAVHEMKSKPSYALRIGFSIKHCAEIIYAEAAIEGKTSVLQKVKLFREVMEIQWAHDVSRRARNELHHKKIK